MEDLYLVTVYQKGLEGFTDRQEIRLIGPDKPSLNEIDFDRFREEFKGLLLMRGSLGGSFTGVLIIVLRAVLAN